MVTLNYVEKNIISAVSYYALSNLVILQFLWCEFTDTLFIMPFIIKSVTNGLVLDVKNQEKKNGAEVILWPYNGGKNQLWDYKNNMIYSKLSG